MSKKKASEQTAAEMNEVEDAEEEQITIHDCIETVAEFITSRFIDLEHPLNGDKDLCESEYQAMINSISCFIECWVENGDDLTISEARGVLYGLAMQYDNSALPSVYECHSLGIFLARFILDCIGDDLMDLVLDNPLMDKEAEQ